MACFTQSKREVVRCTYISRVKHQGEKSADLVFSRRRWLRLSDIQLDKYLNKFHNKVDQELDKRAGKKKENNRQKGE